MTEQRKLEMHEEDKAQLKAFGMSDSDIETLTLMKVVNSAIEEQLATKQPDGTYICIIDASQIVDVLIRTLAYWLGMSKVPDDKNELLGTIAGIASRLLLETASARETFQEVQANGGIPSHVHIIDSGSDAVN